MPLTVPRLALPVHRELVREALARVPSHTPEWTNLNDSDPGPSKAIGDLWRPHRFSFGGVYELQFGDRAGLLGRVAGGWQVSAIQIFQSGQALLLPAGGVFTGQDPRLDPDQRGVDGWFNRAAFAVQPAFTLRTLSVRLARLLPPLPHNPRALAA